MKIDGRSWRVTNRRYFEYRSKAAQGWDRIAVVEHGLKCWWWAIYDGNFFPYKIGACAEKKDAFSEVGGYLLALEAHDLLPEQIKLP